MEGLTFPEGLGALLAAAVFAALLNERLIEVFVATFWTRYKLDPFWLVPISWVTGGVIGWLTGINLFAWLFPSRVAGIVVTAIVIGGGSNLLHQVFTIAKAVKDGAQRS